MTVSYDINLGNMGNDASSGLLPKKDYSVAKYAKIASIRGHFLLQALPNQDDS